MNKIIGILSSITISGIILYCIKLVIRNMIRNNPGEVITLIFNGVGFILVQAIALFEWILNIIL